MNQTFQSLLFVLLLAFTGCSDAWEDQVKGNETTTTKTIIESLKEDGNFTILVNALEKTGLDKELEAYISTIWAPNDEAMKMVSTGIMNNTDSLAQFIGNLFATGIYLYNTETNSQRIRMNGGKYLLMNQSPISMDGVGVSDQYNISAKNGTIHILYEPILVRKNVWELIEDFGTKYKQTGYLNSLTGSVFDPNTATQTGWTADGKPVYDTLSGMVWANKFIEEIADLRCEDSTYTVFIVEDQVFDQEYTKFKPYYKVYSGASQKDSLGNDQYLKKKIVKDFVVTTAYGPDNFPSEVISVDGVRMAVSSSSVVNVTQASNGYVYVINSGAIQPADKIQPIVIEGENEFLRYYAEGGSPAGFLRQREGASDGYDFVLDNRNTDLMGGLILDFGMVASIKYNVYVKAINDFNASYKNPNTGLVLVESLGTVVGSTNEDGVMEFGPPATIAGADSIAVTSVNYLDAVEIYAGSTRFSTARQCYIQISPKNKAQAVVVDYVKMVPVFN
ncbi:MAG: fasciclin domain-containing protein [Bacteroidales bacterium]|nr:fasciclin domain-containing protein [Bacteroidales bacterium]